MVMTTNARKPPDLEPPGLRSRVGPRPFAAIVAIVVLVGATATVLAVLHHQQADIAAAACGLGVLVMRMVITSDDDD